MRNNVGSMASEIKKKKAIIATEELAGIINDTDIVYGDDMPAEENEELDFDDDSRF